MIKYMLIVLLALGVSSTVSAQCSPYTVVDGYNAKVCWSTETNSGVFIDGGNPRVYVNEGGIDIPCSNEVTINWMLGAGHIQTSLGWYEMHYCEILWQGPNIGDQGNHSAYGFMYIPTTPPGEDDDWNDGRNILIYWSLNSEPVTF